LPIPLAEKWRLCLIWSPAKKHEVRAMWVDEGSDLKTAANGSSSIAFASIPSPVQKLLDADLCRVAGCFEVAKGSKDSRKVTGPGGIRSLHS
jgi:hypothetical protein